MEVTRAIASLHALKNKSFSDGAGGGSRILVSLREQFPTRNRMTMHPRLHLFAQKKSSTIRDDPPAFLFYLRGLPNRELDKWSARAVTKCTYGAEGTFIGSVFFWAVIKR